MVTTTIDEFGAVKVVLDLLSHNAIVSEQVRVIYVGPLPGELLARLESVRSEKRR